MIKLILVFSNLQKAHQNVSVFYYGMVVVWLWSGIYRLNCQSEFINVSNRKQQGVWHFFGLEIFTFQIMTTNFPKSPQLCYHASLNCLHDYWGEGSVEYDPNNKSGVWTFMQMSCLASCWRLKVTQHLWQTNRNSTIVHWFGQCIFAF